MKNICLSCQEPTKDSTADDLCQECCEHDDLHKGICLVCSKDKREDMLCDAFDRAKDRD